MKTDQSSLMWYRCLFVLSGLYNVGFGLCLFYSPAALFGFFGLPVLLEDELFRLLAIVIAAFSSIYFYAAWRLERAWWLVLLGLFSKIAPTLFIIAMQLFAGFTVRWYLMLFFNDMIWWLPLVLFLKRRREARL